MFFSGVDLEVSDFELSPAHLHKHHLLPCGLTGHWHQRGTSREFLRDPTESVPKIRMLYT